MDLEFRTWTNELAWIKRILRQPTSTSAEMIRLITGEDDLTLALGIKGKLLAPSSSASPFYQQILQTWKKVHDCLPDSEDSIRAEILWDNPKISSPEHTLPTEVWRGWIDTGILLVHHICHPTENRLLGQEEIANTFNVKCNFLQAMSIRQSIPFSWHSQLTANFGVNIVPRFELIISWTIDSASWTRDLESGIPTG